MIGIITMGRITKNDEFDSVSLLAHRDAQEAHGIQSKVEDL